jgi:hypothetical protein
MAQGGPMTSSSFFFRRDIFRLAAATCILFIVMTVLAMWFYPGGTAMDSSTHGYSFFRNFFSDLGMTRTPSGAANLVSLILFVAALSIVGVGLAIFFIAMRQFFLGARAGKWLSAVAALSGVVTGTCFVGVAVTPWNIYLSAHNEFVMWAFRTFLAAVLLDGIAILLEERLPKSFAFVFLAFAVLLAGYVLLLTFGPAPNSDEGLRVQVIGQKIIVYASVVSVLIQALVADRLQRKTRS